MLLNVGNKFRIDSETVAAADEALLGLDDALLVGLAWRDSVLLLLVLLVAAVVVKTEAAGMLVGSRLSKRCPSAAS